MLGLLLCGLRGRCRLTTVKPVVSSSPNRVREKQESREEDRRALESGEKSRDDLLAENGAFAFPNARHLISQGRLS